MPDNILKYIFRDKSGAKHTVWKSDYDADPRGFAKAYPDARFEVVNRKTGDRGHVSVNDVGAAQKEGFNLFTMKAYQKEHYKKPQTTSQRAQKVAAQYQQQRQQPADYLHRPQSQMGRPQRNVPGKASPFVQSLYEIDNAKKGPDYSVDYTSPKATQQVYKQNQQVRKQAAQSASDHIANDEYRRQSQPMIDNGTVGVMKPMGEIEQEMSDSASKFVDANLGDYINKAVLGEQNAANQRGLEATNSVPMVQAGMGGMGLMVKGMAYNKEVDPDAMAKNLADNARNGFLKLFQNPSFVAKLDNEAARLGVTPEAYIESIMPHLKDRLATTLQQSEYQKALPKNMLDNVANRFIDSNLTGQLLRLATQTRGQRVMQERASAATAAGENPYYKGRTAENVTADIAGFVADPLFGASAKLGGFVAGKLIGNSTKLAALMANGNLAQRLMARGAQAVTSGGVTGFVFDSTGSVIQNYSTGEDTSLGNTLKVAAKGGTTGAVNFATMSLAGIPLSEIGKSVGLKAIKGGSFWGNAGRATAKVGLESGKTYMEAMGMYLGGYVSGKLEGRTDANGKPIEFDLWNGTMESLPTAIGFRLQHAVEGLRGGRKNEKGEDMGWFGSTLANFKDFVTSDKAKESRFLMTEDERNQIFSSGAMNGLMPDGENIVSYAKRTKNKKVSYDDPYLETDASMIKNTYDQIMADPKVSWDAKAKFSAMVTGIMPSARPMMDYITYSSEDYVKDGLLRGKRKYVSEYSAKGELLSKIPYDSKVDRDNVVYKHNIVRENQRLYNAMGLLARQDRNNYELQNDFFVENMKKPGADVNNLVTNMGNEGSDVFRDFSLFALNSEKGTVLNTIDSIAVRNGMKSEDLIKAMKKNPMKRTDFEQNVCVELRRALEAKAFPDGKVHVEQSNLNGKDVAEDNNLGTEKPNGEAVKQELNGLRQAEAEMDALIRDNDVFSQNFKKLQDQGLTNPQIYDWMVQQGGLTVEQLEPFAHYINANARVQGMQEATKQKIEETVSAFVQDWSYHGTFNGQPMNGEQALYVQDSNGRTLLVGSGDVAFDQTTGRAKEGSGDMLVCFDPNTREMVYVKADEVTLFQNQPIDQFAAEYRRRLQMKNSEPYNQAAQEQAMQDAAKPQQEQEAPQDNTTKSEDSTTKEGDLTKDDTTLTKVNTTSGEDNTTNKDLVPQEQPQQTRKFADGTDVPMATDSKGRPTPDYEKMTPEQSAEILTEDFGDNAEKVVDGQIQKAEKALKDAEKMKVDYTAEPNDIMEQETLKNQTIEAAKKQLEHAQNTKKTMTAKKVAETVGKTEQTEGAHEAGSVAAQKFVNAPRLVGNKRTRMLPDGETKIKGHYEIVPAESLTPSHDVNNGYKKSEGFPTDAEGRTVNDRDYEHDKAAQQNTDQIARKYNGMAIEQVPVVSDEGIVYDGNGRTMAGQKAAKEGTDGEYINDLLENAENFGFTREQIEQSGIEHPRLVMVTDERLPYDAATFAKFNRNEKKTQSNTEQAVAKAKTLTSDEVGAIVAEIEGNGSLDAFFNNSKAINDLVKTLVDKGIIGQNEVAQMMDSPERLSAQGREYVKNLLLGSIFKPETIRMLGIDSTVKNKAINAIRSVMDNMKLGEFSLRDEIDQAIQLLYEARQGGNKVDTLLRTSDMFGEDAAKRYPSISQMMALALEGKVSDFRDLLDEYNRIAAARNTGEGDVFGEAHTKPELIKEFMDFKKRQDYGTGHSENEGGNDVSGVEEPQQEASGGNEPAEARGESEPEVKVEGEPEVGTLSLLPKEEKPDPQFNPIEAAAAEFKKEHPLTEDEIMKADVDDLSKDMALDYLNGEVTDDLHRAIYESIYAKRKVLKAEPKVETPKAEPSADPMESFKNAAEGFEKEKKAKAEQPKMPQQTADDEAVAASNKKVNDLLDILKNAGKDEMSTSFIGLNSRQLEVLPKLVSAMAENAYLRIKRGMHNLEDVVKEMRKEFAPAAKIFKKEDVDAIYEQMMNIRYRDGEQRMSLKEWADYYEKTSPKHQENLVGDSKDAEERKQKENSFINRIQTVLSMGEFKTGIAGMRKIAEDCGLEGVKDTDLQELVETAVVGMARRYATSKAMSDDVKFAKIKLLYNRQPSLNQRDSERVMKQQYSTPAPYAYLADMYVKGNGKVIESALEPSAGNGMLTIGLPMDKVHVNDIDAQRLANLRRQGFKNVTSQDGTQPFADKDVDVVVTNPPFGSATPKEHDGYKISSLEGQMAINALESMKDDGRAAIIIGGKTEYAKNGSLNPKDKAFLGYLYSHYNVEDVINVDGGLYAKQGTSYPTRMILINGRRKYDPEHKVFPPVEKDARAEAVKDYDELYKRIEDDILRKRGVQREPLGLSDRERNSDVFGGSLGQKERGGNGVTNNKEHGSGPDGFISDLGTGGSDERPMGETERTPSEHMGDNAELESGRDSDFGADRGTGSASSRLDNGGRVPERPVAGDANETSNERGAGRDRKQQGGQGRSSSSVQRTVPPREGNGLGVKKEEAPKRELSTEKVKYVPQSNNPFSLNSVIPADQARATKKALEKIGDVDSFLVDELGYNDADDMHHALASEQADSVALAIHQAKQGNAFIIGDMTGIGKGRQAAAMIRFAYKQGKIPVFITAKKALFSDMYRDLKSIGNSDLRPFIWAAKDKEHSADMTDSEGKLVYQLPSDKEQERVMDYLQKNGKLPDGYDYIVTTYDSFSSGTMDYEDGKKTVRKNGKGSKNGQRKRDVLEAIAKNANVIMDESHKAGGQGSGSAYLQYVVPKLNAITFLSATYAKRPDNMPIYALRTSMNQAGMKPSELIDAIKRGGATLQEVMSQALTASGQFIRRERDMTGVTIDWKTIDDPVVVEEQREQYDSIIGLFNDIIHFQRTYVGAYLDKRNDELATIQASIKNRQGTKDLGIHNQPFASRTYNMVQQVLLSLKAREAAKSAIEHLKNGEKVVIALNNTNESQTEQYEANAEMEAPDLGVVLMKGLQGVLRYDQTDDMGNKTFGTFNIEDLGPDAVARYHEIEDNIKNASTGLSLSPIDVVRDELEAAGYRVGELTGRQTMFVKNPNGTVSKVKRTNTDKKKLALDFNTNKLDALILNRSASTGISLHDSVEYDVEHKPRTMIVVQQQPDVNEEVQMRGRIDRTGQVNRGRYEYIVSQIPSEQRLLMMFKAKLKSLDANTTSSQKSKFNDMEVSDIINKYGDKVVREYMAEHLDLYSRMADPFGWESSFGEDLSTIDPQRLIVTSGGKLGGKEAGADASKLLGRMALLRVNEQEKMLQEIGELYANEIQRLNEMGENDLEITELPLKAKTIHKEVWKQGAEPGGDNAFADNTYIEKVNMAILKKPMKASEVKASQKGLTGGKTWDEYKTEKKTAVKEYFDQKIADETQRYEERAVKAATKAKEKYIKDGKKGQEKSGMTDEQIEKNAEYQYDTIYKQEKDKLDDVVKNLKEKAEMFDRVLDTFDTNQSFVLPTDMNNPNELSGFGNSYGRLIDIKITDNFSPNASSVSFATLDGRRKITFPIAGKVGSGENKADIIGAIDNMTKQAIGMGDSHLRVLNQNVDNWDRLTSNESRKNGYIVTGNLMQALVDSKDQGLGGQLVKYTTDTGEVKTGILMPDRFDPNGLTNDAPINSVADKFELSSWHGGIDEVTSSDGEVKVKRIDNYRGNFYELRVPKSKAKGGKYFMDEDLLKLVNGNNFETRGNNMLAEFKPEQLKPVLDILSKMGVKVQEERKTSEDEGTHFREEDPQEIELPKDEYAVLAHTIDSSHKNYKRGKVNYEYTADNFYVFKYNKYNDYNVYQKIPIDGNEELINYIKNGINKETIRNPRDIDSALEAGWDGRNGHYWDSTSNQEGRGGSVRPGEVSSLRSRHGRPSDERMGEELSDSPSSAVNNHIERIAQKTGAKVNMVSSVDEITNKAAKAAIEEGRKITGWYNEKTGEVHLYMPNINDRYTAEKTIWHEVVGHKGMRELFGEDRFNQFLRDVWYDLDKPENAELKKLVDEEKRYNPLNIYDAIEEGIARLAEDGKGEPGFWNGIKNKVSDFLHEIGYRIAPNTKDVKYLLWLSKNLQKNPNDPYWKLRAEAVKYRLDHDRVPAVVERNGMYFDNDGKNHDYLLDLNHKDFEEATDGKVHFRTSPMAASKIEEYNRRLGTKLYAFKESTLNHLQALEEAMKLESGEKDVWKDIPSAFNPLQAANRMDSVCQQISAKYDSDITEPLAASFKRMVSVMDGKNKDEQKRNAELYMITKHGLERNRVLYVRDTIRDLQKDETTKADADRLQRDWNATFKDLGDKLDDGTVRFDQFIEKMDEWIRHNIAADYDSEAHDYSGLTAIKKERGKNDPDYSCVDDVMNTEDKMGKELVKEYWKNKTAATDFIIDQEYYNGFKDSAERNHLKSMFKFYIPLRKFDETTAEDIYGYITEKGDPGNYIGSVIANAKGRESLSDVNVLAQISAMAKASILNGGKNVVKQHLLRFTQTYANGNNGNRIFLEINPWAEKHTIDGKEVWEEVTPQIPENATQEQISNIVQNFESSMQAKKENGEAKLYNRRGSLEVRFQKASDKDQHIIEVYVAGKKRLLFCQGNPRAAQAVNGLIKDSGASKTWAAKNSAKINRFCALANTSYNIDFMFSNLTRDLTVATANVTKEGPKYTRDFCMEYLDNLTSFRKGKEGNYWSMFSRYRKNKLDMNNDRERMFKEFMDNGGQTGFTEIKKLEDMMKEYDNLIKKGNMKGDNKVLAAMKNGLNYIEVANEIFENIARYSCYVTSRKAGRSVGRSIYDAKEVSGNFNKHGSGDAIKRLKTANDNKGDVVFRNALGWFNSYMKNYTMFYNAGVQGASLFARNFKRNAAGMSMVFGVIPFALGIAQALINQYRISNEDEKERGGIEDPYAELPEWKRRNNICIYWGKGEFKTIPIGIELRAFFGLGDIVMGQSIYPGLKSDTPVGCDILGQIAQLVPASDFLGHHSPSGGTVESFTDLGLAAAPTALKPELELIANRDWTGRPIYRGGDYLDYAPRWKRAYDSTSGVFMDINKWANMTFNDFPDPTEDMKGNDAADFITAPYIYQHLLEGYFGGAGSTVSRIAKTGYKAVTGNFDEIDPNQIPLYRVFNYKPSEGHDMQRTKSKWYNYSDELKQTEYNIKQLKTNTPDVLKNLENNAKKFNFTHGEEGKAYNIWKAADSYISKKKRQLNKVSDPEVIKSINEDINRKMQEAVNDLDKLN